MSKEFKKQFVTYILGAFGLVAALAWNDAIKSLIEYLNPLQQNILWTKFVYALIITLLVSIVSWLLIRSEEDKK